MSDAVASGFLLREAIALLVIGTSLWVAFDASRRDWGEDSFANRPWKWFVGSILLWIVVFPLYLHRRHRAPHS